MKNLLVFSVFFIHISCTVYRIPVVSPDHDNYINRGVVKALPEGWVLNGVLAAAWGSSYEELIKTIPDTSFGILFYETPHEIDSETIDIYRARVTYSYTTGVSKEDIVFEFVNLNYLSTQTQLLDADYILSEIKRSIYLVNTPGDQLMSEDLIKYKVLMEYGSPTDYDGQSYLYYNNVTEMTIKEVDNAHVLIHLTSIDLKRTMAEILDSQYSREAKQKQKQLLLDEIDL